MYLILGLARSGLGAASFLKSQGLDFVVFDDNSERCKAAKAAGYKVLSGTDWPSIKTLLISPGVPLSYPAPHPIVAMAIEHGCEVITDLTLLQQFAPHKRYIGVTGTNGKSTTTALITHIIKSAGIDAVMVGNIGVSALELGLDHAVYVMELSSFQLERSPALHLDVAVLTNISEDHLAQHGTMEAYIAAKERIFLKAKHQIRDIHHYNASDLPLDHPTLKGEHNRENMLAAYYALRAFGMDHEAIVAGISTFRGLKHRQQYLGTKGPVMFINDSKATGAAATQHALKTFENIYWLVGGQDKSDGIDPLSPHFHTLKKAYVYGAAKERFARTLKDHNMSYAIFDTLEEALTAAYEDASREKNSRTILLSPACTSYDQYKDFEARGDHFIELVENILSEKSLSRIGSL